MPSGVLIGRPLSAATRPGGDGHMQVPATGRTSTLQMAAWPAPSLSLHLTSICLHLATSLLSSKFAARILLCVPTKVPRLIPTCFLTAAPKEIPIGAFSQLTPRGHYRLVIPSATGSGRLDPAGSVGITFAVEEVTTVTRTDDMWKRRPSALLGVRQRSFVLFDTDLKRGWLVGGDIVALHLLRVHLKLDPESRNFDFSSLNLLDNDVQSAHKVLSAFNDQKDSLNKIKDMEEKPESSDDKKPAETREEAMKRVIGTILDGIYAVLLQLSTDARTINKRGGLSGQVQTWYDEKWGTTLRGWDFNKLANVREAEIYTLKLDKDPGWLRMTRELNAVILFANGLGEILEPRAGSCCPYFPTLPTGQNFLATDMEVVERLIREYGGTDPADKIIARLSPRQGWERRLDPFARPNCQGDHLNALEPSCFPVQGIQSAPWEHDMVKRHERDAKLLKRMYTKGEIQAMVKDNKKGMVVFGRQPGSEELKNMYRQGQQNRLSGTPPKAEAASTIATPASRPSTRGSTPGSNGLVAGGGGPTLTAQSKAPSNGVGATAPSSAASAPQPKTVTQKTRSGPQQRTSSVSSERSAASASESNGAVKQRIGQPLSASAQRTPSISSVRSTASSTQPVAPSTGTGAELPRTSHQTASSASLRSNNAMTRPKAAIAGSDQSHVQPAQSTTPIATRKASNSSVRTTGSAASQATGRSNTQAPAGQPSTAGLKKTATNSSAKSSSSRSSKSTQNSTSGTTAAESRQRQQRLEQLGATTAVASNSAPGQSNSANHGASPSGTTENPHSTSSGPAPTEGRGSDGSS